jgi:hypothetical protein
MSNKLNNGPDESWNPLIFLEADQLKEVLNEKKSGQKSDSGLEQQSVFLKTDCVNEASGSSYIEIGNTKVYWNYIKKEFIRNRTDFKLFLTTDTKSIEHEAEKEFGKMNVIINDGPLRHLDRELNLGKQHCHRVEKTFLDFHCLQLCDMAIISESGFGKLGVWNRPNPSEKLAMFTKMQKLVVFNNSNELIII